ncbi:MAG TPA: hypothetical protein VIK93_03390 [Limnochordales bacterium]
MATAAVTGHTRLDEARVAQVKEKFLQLLDTDRASEEFERLYREVDAALEELVAAEWPARL